jgi:hypothetical protein
MRSLVLILALLAVAVVFSSKGTGKAVISGPAVAHPPTGAPDKETRVDFFTQIKPILSARCQPCHFNGGKVYDKMPFDRPETIKRLGTRLFTRIKDEHEQELIRAFLAQN